jgi:hypothetical protein
LNHLTSLLFLFQFWITSTLKIPARQAAQIASKVLAAGLSSSQISASAAPFREGSNQTIQSTIIA